MSKFKNIGIVVDQENGHVAYLRTDKSESDACIQILEWLAKLSIEQNLKSSDVNVEFTSYDPNTDKWTLTLDISRVQFDLEDFRESEQKEQE